MSLARQLLTVFFGVLCVAFSLQTVFLTTQRFLTKPSSHPLITTKPNEPSVPQALLLPTHAEPLPIIVTPVQNNDWQVSTKGVSLMQSSLTSHGKVLYGHNWPNLLGSLHQAEVGSSIQIRYSDLKQEAYTVQSMFTVEPSQLNVLELAKDPDTLLIYTCSGWLDQERLVVVAIRDAKPGSENAVSKL
jgi:LPXTG-site transpeptidase (sortase) family protein